MYLPAFGVEEWLNQYEKEATYDIAGSSIASLTLDDLFSVTGTDSQRFFQTLAQKPMDYG